MPYHAAGRFGIQAMRTSFLGYEKSESPCPYALRFLWG